MTLKALELVFVFFSKIYIFFYKEKGNYWEIFPIIIMSTILMLNIEVILLQFYSLKMYFPVLILLPSVLIFNVLLRKIDYDWVVQYEISRMQKIAISIVIFLDFIIVGILLNMSRSASLAAHIR